MVQTMTLLTPIYSNTISYEVVGEESTSVPTA